MKLTQTSVLFLGLAACSHNNDAGMAKRGQQLVSMGGCADCHTPKHFDPKLGMPVPDDTHFLAGHPEGAPDPDAQPGQTDMAVIGPTFTSFKTGFGVVYSRNLTPDRDTGLGAWTPEQFIQTMRTGHHQGTGRVLLPPMPWQNLATASDADLRAIFAYLRTIPAVHNQVPDPKVPAPAMAAIEASYQKVKL
ncbi:MAG: diheme cytochrome c-553 [Deltaproteobacteria bacterium]|nr:diheme cytochrome c-553 [Deltaproteobacteria bacterium]